MYDFVGPYRILRLINRGGQGSVYLGFDERLTRHVAIKIYVLPGERERRRALLREARMIARLESPKIVKVYDVIESPGHLGMVMEYVPGCSLEDLLQHRCPSLASAMTIGIDLAAALTAARRERVVHADLKASNVLITPAGRAKLTDFGIARNAQSGPQLRQDTASWSALSPEQYSGEPIDGQSDLFALGMLLYRMLSGEHPFVSGGRLDAQRLCRASYVPLAQRLGAGVDIPEELEQIIGELLRGDPARRPGHTRGVRQILRNVLRAQPLAAQSMLAAEARPFFRDDAAGDLPTRFPSELAREGRSRLPPTEGIVPWARHWLRGLRWRERLALAAGGLVLAAVVTVALLQVRSVSVSFSVPALYGSVGRIAPEGFSSDWMLHQVVAGLSDRFGRVEVRGEVGVPAAISLRASGQIARPAQPADHRVDVAVRCLQEVCIVDLTLADDSDRHAAQVALFPAQSLEEWTQALRGAAARLVP